MVNRTHIITPTVQGNAMHHRKVLLNSFPYSDIPYSSKRRPFPIKRCICAKNNNNVVKTIPCRVQLSNKRHPQISATLEQAPHLRREKFSAAASIRVNTLIKVSACEIILSREELTSTLIISDVAKTESKNCCIMHYFDIVLENHALDQPVQGSRSVQISKNSGRAVK